MGRASPGTLFEFLNACQAVMGRGGRGREAAKCADTRCKTPGDGVWSGPDVPGLPARPPSTAGQREAGLGVQVDGRIRDKLNRGRRVTQVMKRMATLDGQALATWPFSWLVTIRSGTVTAEDVSECGTG